jgi:hypothetical protein
MPRSHSSSHRSSSHNSSFNNGRITHSYTGAIMPRPPAVAPAAAPVASSTPFQVQSKTGLFQSIKEGFGFGVGTNIARSMFGQSEPAASSAPSAPAAPLAAPPSVAAPPTVVSPSQEKQKKVTFNLVYTQCMLEGGSEDFCKQLSETLN